MDNMEILKEFFGDQVSLSPNETFEEALDRLWDEGEHVTDC